MEFKHPKYYKEMRKLARELRQKSSSVNQQDLRQPTSSQASEHKPSSPELRGQASSPRNPVPRSRNQGTSGSVQALGNKQQG